MNLLSLAKKSAKEIFKLIRRDEGFFCGAIEGNIEITKKFLQHICYHEKKDRSAQEIMERILIIPFVQKVLQEGVFINSRKEYNLSFIRLEYTLARNMVIAVVIEKKQERHLVLSCFRVKTKKDLSLDRRTPHHMP